LFLRYQEKLEALEARLRIIDEEEAASGDTAVKGIAPEATSAGGIDIGDVAEDLITEDASAEDATPEGVAPDSTAPEDAAPESTASEDAALENAAPEDTPPESTAPEGTAAEVIAPENGHRRPRKAERLMYSGLSKEQVFKEIETCLPSYCKKNLDTWPRSERRG
jgi:hypothetical protein